MTASELRLCAICGRRPGELVIRIRSTTRALEDELATIRAETWCVPCAEAVVDRASGETVWCQPGGGYGNWLPASEIPA